MTIHNHGLRHFSEEIDTFPKIRKQSSALDSLVEGSFPHSPVKAVRKKLKHCITAPDPRPILDIACKMLQQLKNDRGNSLLHEAVLEDNKSLARLCLKHGYENCKNDTGDTPLHVAIRVNNSAMFWLILKNNPMLLLENKNSQTACELACALGHTNYIKELLSRATSLDQLIPRSRQHSVLSLLWQNSHDEIISLAAVIYQPKNIETPYTWDFKRKNLHTLGSWIKTPLCSSDQLKFSLSSKDWELLLFHFVGKKTTLFAKDRQHLQQGSHEYQMYVPVLWSWRRFCERHPENLNPLWQKIDQAISRTLPKANIPQLVKDIKKGTLPIILASGWHSHSITVVFIGTLLFICNRGRQGTLQKAHLTAYRIQKAAITAELIKNILDTTGKKEECNKLLFNTLPKTLYAKEDAFCQAIKESCQPSSQENPNCVVASMRTAIRAILLSQAEKTGNTWQFDAAKKVYKEYALSSRYAILQQYLQNVKASR